MCRKRGTQEEEIGALASEGRGGVTGRQQKMECPDKGDRLNGRCKKHILSLLLKGARENGRAIAEPKEASLVH